MHNRGWPSIRGRGARTLALSILPAALVAALLAGCADAGSKSSARIIGKTGMGPGEFSYPRAAVVAPSGDLYVVDKAGRVQCFDAELRYRLEWRMPATAAGKPTGLGVDRAGRIFVADTHYSSVKIYEPDGTFVRAFGLWGDEPGRFRLVTDVAVDEAGFIYVGEYAGNDRISKFAPDGTFVLSFGGADAGEARMERPQALLLAADGALFVCDACRHRVCRFTRDGRFLGAFGRQGSQPGALSFPYGIDQLPDGTLVVAEYGNNRIQRFSPDGQSLGVWGQAGRKPGELAYPWAVVVGAKGQIYVIDSGNNRVQRLGEWEQAGRGG